MKGHAVCLKASPCGPSPPRSPVERELVLSDTVKLKPPVILAPMAGITSAPFRLMSQRYGAQLCVSEMIIASTLVQRNERALQLARWHPDEAIKSAQLYGVRPDDLCQAAAILVEEHGVQHIDLNFGCPVRKVTSRGGGAAIPLKLGLLRDLVRGAVQGAKSVPVTVKTRLGLSASMGSYRDAALIAQDAGAAALTLHTRYANQLYAPPVQWDSIAKLTELLDIPVIGNGDVFEGTDAVRMLQETGAAGVMIGRACLGRPWVFEDVKAALTGLPSPAAVSLRQALTDLLEHVATLAEWDGCERSAVLQMRKFVPLYLHGFASAIPLRTRLLRAASLQDYDDSMLLCDWDPGETCHPESARYQRLKGGQHGETSRVVIPQGWLEDAWTYDVSAMSEEAVEG